MADHITVICPECDSAIDAPPEFEGKKVRCKACDYVFVAKARPSGVKKAAKAPPPAKAAAPPAAKAAVKPAPQAPKPAAPAPKKPHDDDGGEVGDDGKPYGLTEEYLGPRCPECANAMEEDAVICLACGYNTLTRQRLETRKTKDITGKDVFVWLLPGILCALAFLLGVGFDIWYCMQIDELVQREWYEFISYGPIKFWFVTGTVFGLWKLLKFAVKRLILHPRPPEIELRT